LSAVPPGGASGAQVDAAAGADDPGLARERTSLAWTRSGLSIAASGALIVRGCLSAHLDALGIVIAVVMAIVAVVVWRHGQQTYAEPGLSAPDRRRQSRVLAGLTIATVFTALLAIIVTLAVSS
jgi:uncharacterized membrane protein YidH (DUF202 family)